MALAALFVAFAAPSSSLAGKAFNCSVEGPPEPGIRYQLEGGEPRSAYTIDGVGEGSLRLKVPTNLRTDGSGAAVGLVEAVCHKRTTGRVRLTLSARGDQPLTCELCFTCDRDDGAPREASCFGSGADEPDPEVTRQGCQFLREVSEETDPVQCQSGYAAAGLVCYGNYCDEKQLICCPYLDGPDPGTTCSKNPDSISEEPPENRFFTQDTFLCGLGCSGKYCDRVTPWTLDFPSRLSNKGRKHCFEGPFISEEPGNMVYECPVGSWLAGLTCRGDYCDELSLICCEGEIVP